MATTTVEPGLEIQVSTPDTVERAEKFDVRFVVQNRGDGDVVVESPTSCPVYPVTFDLPSAVSGARSRVRFEGVSLICRQAFTQHEIPEGDTLGRTFQMEALKKSGEPVEPSTYAGRVEFDWTVVGRGEVMLSALEWKFSVVPP